MLGIRWFSGLAMVAAACVPTTTSSDSSTDSTDSSSHSTTDTGGVAAHTGAVGHSGGSTCDTAVGDITVPVFVFDPDNPTPCYVWQEVTVPAEYWCEYAASLESVSGCAFGDILLRYETADGLCYMVPGDCVSDPTLTYYGAGCSTAPECTEGRPDF